MSFVRKILMIPVIFCAFFQPLPSNAGGVVILAAGDVVLAHRIKSADMDFFSDGALNLIRSADAFFWNCESSGLSTKSKGNDYVFLSKGSLIGKFAFPNSVASTSNNHVFDGYEDGARHLMASFKSADANHNGLHLKGEYSPFELILSDDTKLFFLAGGPMSQSGGGTEIVTLNYDQILEQIAATRTEHPNSIIVTFFHDGVEGKSEVTQRQKYIARRSAENGADVVLFSHNHMYGTFQVLADSPRKTFVAWGLGNFIFGGNAGWKNKKDAKILKIDIDTNTMKKSGLWINGRLEDWKFFLASEDKN